MNRNKKELERLRKRQIRDRRRNISNSDHQTTIPCAPHSTAASCKHARLQCRTEDSTTLQHKNTPVSDIMQQSLPYSPESLIHLLGNSDTEVPDDIIIASINLLKATINTESEYYIGYYMPAQIHLFTSETFQGENCQQPEHIPVDKHSINIHPLNQHWVTSYYNKTEGQLYVYDSLRSKAHLEEVMKQLKMFYENDIVSKLKYVNVTQQSIYPICGVMAVAFAVTCAVGQDPSLLHYDITKARSHLQHCFANGTMKPFTVTENNDSWLPSYLADQREKNRLRQAAYRQKQQNSLSDQQLNAFREKEKHRISQIKLTTKKSLSEEERMFVEGSRTPLLSQYFSHQQLCDKNKKRNLTVNDSQNAKIRKQKSRAVSSNRANEKLKDKEHKQRMRKEPELRNIERVKEKESKRKVRKEPELRNIERVKEKESKRKVRKEPELRNIERVKEKESKRKVRKEPELRNIERVKEKESKRKVRKEPELRNIERVKEKESKRKVRKEPELRITERVQQKEYRHKIRKEPELRNTERVQQKEYRHKIRKEPELRNTERVQQKEYRHKIRKEPELRNTERVQQKEYRHKIRKEPELRNTEKVQQKEYRHKIRKEPELRNTERVQQKEYRHKIRKEPELRNTEKVQQKEYRHKIRKEPELRNTERVQQKEYRHKIRKEPELRNIERVQQKEYRNKIRNNFEVCEQEKQNKSKKRKNLKAKYSDIEAVIGSFRNECKEMPCYACSVCYRLMFRKQVKAINKEKYEASAIDCVNACIENSLLHEPMPYCTNQCSKCSKWICFTCDRNLLLHKIPSQALANGLALSQQPECLRHLNQLEKHLISPVIPFMKILSLPKGQQKGVHGPVVCVPADLSTVTQILPRQLSDTSLVKVKLKRKMEYKGHHLYQQISLQRLKSALEHLKNVSPHFSDVILDVRTIDPDEEPGLVLPDMEEEPTVLPDVEEEPTVPECDPDDEVIESSHTEPSSSAAPLIGEITRDDTPVNNTVMSGTLDAASSPQTVQSSDVTHVDDIHDTSAPMVSCLQPENLSTHLTVHSDEDVLYNIAPAQGNKPGSVFDIETKAFPYLFPHGKNGYQQDRNTLIGYGRYANTRLFSADPRFAADPQYIFYTQFVSELKRINSSVSVAMRKGSPTDNNVTASILKDPSRRQNILKSNQGYHFLSNTRGSPAYWEKTLRDLFAMVRQMGTPTWFCSFSAADRRWPEIVEAICKQQGKSVPEDMDWSTYTLLINSNPVTACRMFENRVQNFISKVILSPAMPIGKVTDYFLRTEFQSRGWPHIHCLFWCEDAPKFDSENPNNKDFLEFIDQYITCDIPNKDDSPELHQIVTSVQMHSKSHSPSCKKGGRECRFNFPKPPSARTFIATPTPPPPDVPLAVYREKAHNLLNIVWHTADKAESLGLDTAQEVLNKVVVSQENYETAHCAITKRNTVILQRDLSQCWVNPYNEHLLLAWNGNMDIQPVLDAYSCIMYIVSYITKAERELGDLLKRCQKESLQGNLQPIQQLRTLGNVYLNAREISIMEAIYRSCGMNLRQCSRSVTFIPTDPDGVRITKPLNQLQPTDEDSEIWMTGTIERYLARPSSTTFDNMCLADFASQYQTVSRSCSNKPTEEDCNEDLESDAKKSATYTLANNLGVIKKRQKESIIRYTRFNKDKNTQKHYFTLLRLYLPHRSLVFKSEQNYEEQFHSKSDVILPNMSRYEQLTDEIDDAWQLIQQGISTEDAWASILPNQEAQRAEEDEERRNMSEFKEESEEILDAHIPDLNPKVDCSNKPNNTTGLSTTHTSTANEHRQRLQTMNEDQKQLFYFVRDWALRLENGETTPPFHILLTGGAGTGKSHLIKCIFHEVDKTLSRKSGNPDCPVALLVAYTGTAAFNIEGRTIHSAFSITKAMHKSLNEDQANTLRCQLQDLKLLIIDEVSLVSTKLLEMIHCRLQQIKQPSMPQVYFGNVSVLAVGDFYQTPPVGARTLLSNQSSLTDLWNNLFYKWELSEIMRQKGDIEFMTMLNRLRKRDKSKQISEQDKALLQSRIISKDNPEYPEEALHVAATHAQLNIHNEYMLDQLRSHHQCYCLLAADTCTDTQTQRTYIKKDPLEKKEAHLSRCLTVCVGARVMITTNIDVEDGLTNGAIGTITAIVPGKQQLGLPEAIYVHFDNMKIGLKTRQKQVPPPNVNPASTMIKTQTEVIARKPTVTRHQYPFLLAWAVTIHKVQGMTTEKIVVSLSKIFKPGMAYVALSRATKIQDLFLLDKDFDEQTIYCDTSIHKALESMSPAITLPQWLPSMNITSLSQNGTTIIASHNIEGLLPHLDDFTNNSIYRKCDIIALQETWIRQNASIRNPLTNYSMHLQPRNYSNDPSIPLNLQTAEKGGVALFIHQDYDYEVIPTMECEIECVAVKLMCPDLSVYSVYRPPLLPKKYFILKLIKLLKASPTQRNIVVGDFNIDLIKSSNSALVQAMTEIGYNQIINKPTTARNTLLDHIYQKDLDVKASGVVPTYYSYHDVIFLAV